MSTKKHYILDDVYLQDIKPWHRLMSLYLKGLKRNLTDAADVYKYQLNIAKVLDRAGITLTLSADVIKNAAEIDEILCSTQRGKDLNDNRRC